MLKLKLVPCTEMKVADPKTFVAVIVRHKGKNTRCNTEVYHRKRKVVGNLKVRREGLSPVNSSTAIQSSITKMTVHDPAFC